MDVILLLPEDEACRGERFARICFLVDEMLGSAHGQETDGSERMAAAERCTLSGVTVLRCDAALASCIAEGGLNARCILLLAAVDASGINLQLYAMLKVIRTHHHCMEGSYAGMILDGGSENWTKALAREAALTFNNAGCTLVGRPLCEATGSLLNHQVRAELQDLSLQETYELQVKELIMRLAQFPVQRRQVSIKSILSEKKVLCQTVPAHGRTGRRHLLCVHACSKATSNTWSLWNKVKNALSDEIEVQEISLRGPIQDCAGCSFETCMYFSRQSGCFFGGTIVEQVFPALEKCDALIVLSPNYNDALGASLTAFINRLTALYRKKPFSDKYLYAIVVSGYSGSDLVAEQILGSLCMNKSFILPGCGILQATAMHPGSIETVPGIEDKARAFAARIAETII